MEIIILKDEEEVAVADGQEVFLIERSDSGAVASHRKFKIADNARVKYLLLNINSEGDYQRLWSLGENVQLAVYNIMASDSGQSLWNLDYGIGEGSRFNDHSLLLTKNDSNVSVKADYRLQKNRAFSRTQSDLIASGSSQADYDANLRIEPNAQKTDGRLDLYLRLVGEESKGKLLPALNIEANDVKAGHSASTFKLSDEDLFYLRSRGLSIKEIEQILLKSVMSRFFKDFNEDKLREELEGIIEKFL